MNTSIKFRWKPDFQNTQWYKDNPAEQYLSWQTKAEMMEDHILGREDDLDSEAELYIDGVQGGSDASPTN